ncbi:hypothetical protein ACLOJK_027706 [Asimina triloba]
MLTSRGCKCNSTSKSPAPADSPDLNLEKASERRRRDLCSASSARFQSSAAATAGGCAKDANSPVFIDGTHPPLLLILSLALEIYISQQVQFNACVPLCELDLRLLLVVLCWLEWNDEKYRCSETGYRIPLKCVESGDGSKVANSKALRKRSVLEDDTRSNSHIHPQLHTAVRHLKWRRLLDTKFTMEDNKRTYIIYRSCVPPVSEEKLTVIGFEPKSYTRSHPSLSSSFGCVGGVTRVAEREEKKNGRGGEGRSGRKPLKISCKCTCGLLHSNVS